LLDCPSAVVAGSELELKVGLSEKPGPGVAGTRLVRPKSSVGAYQLAIQVVAEGFSLRPGESWRVLLEVTRRQPYPSVTLHLTAPPDMPVQTEARAAAGGAEESLKEREIRATFSVDGQPIGLAVRYVTVARTAADLPDGEQAPALGVDMAVPATPLAADLTVWIHQAGDQLSGLTWTYETAPYLQVTVPSTPDLCDIGNAPADFSRGLMNKVNAKEGKRGVYILLRGFGRLIAQKVPNGFWDLLRQVQARRVEQGRSGVPSLLLISQDPYVPWELAVVGDKDLLDPAAPPFLSAQTDMGRWVQPDPKLSPDRQRPQLPPPDRLRVAAMAAISGVYSLPALQRLREAEAEAAELKTRYAAKPVDASTQEVLQCLDGNPPADLLHFAVHGKFDPKGWENGLMLIDGNTLDPLQVMGSDLVRHPFVFLNACQVGQGDQLLGDYAGMASAFLFAGASGVIAPLWSVKDDIARQLALDFYQQALPRTAATVTPAQYLRLARANFKATSDAQSATWLAYQFFGHPAYKLERA
jgi:hypothetical protein